MVINWNTTPDEEPTDPPRVRAAEYVRMSTKHQQYSTDNQAVAIRRYAEEHGYEIVHTYKDDGKSGLNLSGRSGLKLLLADIDAGRTDFQALLVYDVSRLGRFQDPDEAATHELRIRVAGIQVEYWGTLRGRKLLAAKRIVESRRRRGKHLDQNTGKKLASQKLSPAALVRAYQEDVDRKRALIKRSNAAGDRLLLVTEALRRLRLSEQFTALVEDEDLATLPKNLAARLDRMEAAP